MAGMYKVLDAWIKEGLPVLPDRSLQESLLHLLSRDSSVLLDFLVSNETCFLLYLLRFLKFIVKDWPGFVSSCHIHYDEVIQVLLGLQHSISRLLSKNLFPYNIGPVYRLLDKVDSLHRTQKNS